MPDNDTVYFYDTTLRDGAQTSGVHFSVTDKLAMLHELDALGIDYIEAGWPGANPVDEQVFAALPSLKKSRITAFGMTHRPGHTASNDPGLAALLNSDAPALCIVGKSWDAQAQTVLGISPEENRTLIDSSLRASAARGKETLFDAEHFFDGYKANAAYALDCLRAAADAGACWLTLCDTNGGTLPHDIERIVADVRRQLPAAGLGIHCHNDTETAVAASIAAVRAGVRLVQGTFNGLGERCGNANLTAIIPAIVLKMGLPTTLKPSQLKGLTPASRRLDERLGRQPNRHAAYVGEAAFAHKGGLHVAAVNKDPSSYEHIPPESVGNRRHILVSDQSGKASILARLRETGIDLASDHPKLPVLLEQVKNRQYKGYAYEQATASFELLARQELYGLPRYFRLTSFRVLDERRWDEANRLMVLSEATVKGVVKEQESMTVAEGNGPVNALDKALRALLLPHYPVLESMRLVDYKVRILTSSEGTEALTRVHIESSDTETGHSWTTVGVSANIVEASYQALRDALSWRLLQQDVASTGGCG